MSLPEKRSESLLPASDGPTRIGLVRVETEFSCGDSTEPGTRMDERSWEIARTLSIVVGERTPVVERYLRAFSHAPAAHLELLASRDMRVIFAAPDRRRVRL